ncbi:MFS transporter [Brucella sp. NBRC 12950]|uniref:MFS transporter n=1 Tax=Brucella sp. NBRC 12950 TaxID=2994518 RepID=UPI0024A48A2D|nr:MFS transporter [Brucella sp. NBRC 12950]GLU27579.1 MFS transporter [Brucella sp. NBRC 12950]
MIVRSRRLFLACMFFFSVGRNAFFVATAWIMLVATDSVRAVALLLIAGTVTEFVVSGPTGIIADRWNRQVVCIAADLARILVVAMLGISLAGGISSSALYIGVISYSAADRLYMTAIQSIVPSISPPDRLVSFNAWSYVGMQTGNFAGAFAVGLLLDLMSDRYVFWSIALCFIASTLLMQHLRRAIRTTQGRRSHQVPVEAEHETEGVAQIWRMGALRNLAIIYAQIYTTGMLINTLLSGYVLREMQGTSIEFGNLEAAWAVGSVVSGILLTTAYFRTPTTGALRYALFAAATGMSAFYAVPSFVPAVALIAALGAVYNTSRILIDVEIQRTVTPRFLGRVKGVIQATCMGFGLIVYGLVAALGDSILPSTAFANYGVFMIVTVVLLSLYAACRLLLPLGKRPLFDE